jgi:hypothetical protein
MSTVNRTVPPSLTAQMREARRGWKLRVARIGSLIQLAFAAFWLARAPLATEWPGKLVLAVILAATVVGVGVWGEARTRGLAPRPRGMAARHIERAVTVATVLQLAVSFVLPVVLSSLGRSDLTLGTISVTIGLLLLWLYVKLNTYGHLVAGVLLVVVPIGLALALSGHVLTAATGFATGAVLIANAVLAMRWLRATARQAGITEEEK